LSIVFYLLCVFILTQFSSLVDEVSGDKHQDAHQQSDQVFIHPNALPGHLKGYHVGSDHAKWQDEDPEVVTNGAEQLNFLPDTHYQQPKDVDYSQTNPEFQKSLFPKHAGE
jgi:regulatory protein YycI of two-component signal transduction system YycFG